MAEGNPREPAPSSSRRTGPRPKGYANGIAGARPHRSWSAGRSAGTPRAAFPPGFAGQVQQALRNILAVLAEAGGGPEHIARLTWYVTDMAEYLDSLRALGAAYRDVMGRHFPAMALVEVAALVEAEAKVEIEATAVVPD